MVSKKYSALIVGCGNMGCMNDAPGSGNEYKTISYAKALKENGNFEVSLCDIDNSKARECAKIWGCYNVDYGNEGYHDVVIIATPDDTHYFELYETLNESPKLVICEKPLCSTVEEAKEIIKLYEEAKIPILVDYTRRFIPYYQRIKTAYDNGDFGKLITGNYTFNRGWLHTASHIIDFHNWMFGDANAKILEVNDTDYRIFSIDLFFEKQHISERRIGDKPVSNIYDYHTRYVIDNAYKYLEGKEELLCTMYDGLKALEIMERLCK